MGTAGAAAVVWVLQLRVDSPPPWSSVTHLTAYYTVRKCVCARMSVGDTPLYIHLHRWSTWLGGVEVPNDGWGRRSNLGLPFYFNATHLHYRCVYFSLSCCWTEMFTAHHLVSIALRLLRDRARICWVSFVPNKNENNDLPKSRSKQRRIGW